MPSPPLDAHELDPDEVEPRLRAARAQGRPAYPWPEVPIPAWRACLAELTRVVGVLLSEPATRVTLEVDDEDAPRCLTVAAFTSGLGPLLGHWLERGRLETTPLASEVLSRHLHHARARARVLRAMLVEALELLSAAGVEATVLKGAHTGAAYFPEPATRPSADVDLLVAPTAFDAAARCLSAAGWTAGAAQSRPRKADWRPPGSPLRPRSLYLVHEQDPRAVELHASLEQDFFGVACLGPRADAPRRPLPEAHPTSAALAPTELAVHLALHASRELHRIQVIRLVELALVLRAERLSGGLPVGAFAAALREIGGLAFALPALDLTEKLVRGSVEPDLLREARAAAPPRMRRYLAGQEPWTVQRLEGVSLRERLIWCRSGIDVARRLAHLALSANARGSSRPPLRGWLERASAVLRGRVQLRTSSARLRGGAGR